MAATAVMGFSQIGGAIAQSSAARTQGEFQQLQAEINARFAEIEAADTIRRGDKESKEHQKKVRKAVGSQRAVLAAQGVQVDADTALDLQKETAEVGALDAQTIKHNAWRQAFGFKQEALASRFQGRFDRMTAENRSRNTLITGGLNAISSFTSGIGRKG